MRMRAEKIGGKLKYHERGWIPGSIGPATEIKLEGIADASNHFM